MQLLVYTQLITPRLEYITSTLFNAIGVGNYLLTNNVDEFKESNQPKINYSPQKMGVDEIWIKPVSLLFQTDIKIQEIICKEWKDLKIFFGVEGDLPFDMFAASFYLITRYEEYLPHRLDEYGRYGHANSLAFKENFLSRPLVNLWLKEFVAILKDRFPGIILKPTSFNFIPTYDIDIAWSYLNKGLLRNVGGLTRSLIKGDVESIQERIAVLSKKQKDPYNIFDWLDDLHLKYHLQPYYFFLLAKRQKSYDKNISPSNPALQSLIKNIALNNSIGIHPSWQSGEVKTLLGEEIRRLNKITGNVVNSSRQHYIQMTLPDTYEHLLHNGIEKDFSMGYGSINGFRASYCLPFKWYDLAKEEPTSLTIYPFCYMEANSFYEQHYTLRQSKEELMNYYEVTKRVSGLLITIFHNHTLGNKKDFAGWMDMYEEFCRKVSEPGS